MSAGNAGGSIKQYLVRLRKALGDVPSTERDEIVEEIRSHILERIEAQEPATEQVVNEILRAVGDPKELASQYKTEALLRRARTSQSPLLLLRTTLRWAMSGLAGVIAFLVTAVGYGCAAVCYLCALLKPVFPARIGLWLGPEHTMTMGYWNGRISATEVYGIAVRPPASFALGTLSATEGPVRELLGPWLFPVTLLFGVVFLMATTRFARWFIGKFGQRRSRRSLG